MSAQIHCTSTPARAAAAAARSRAIWDTSTPVTCQPQGEAVHRWLRCFVDFVATKHAIAVELLEQTTRDNPLFDTSRDRVLAAGRPLLAAAQQTGEIQAELTLEQLLDMVIALSAIRGDAGYREPILHAALNGIRGPADARPSWFGG